MAAQLGRNLVLRIGDGGSPTENFTTIAGMQTKSFTINAGEPADISDSESANQWQEMLEGAGYKSIEFSGDGVFKDATSDETLRSKVIPQQLKTNYQIVVPDFGTYEGPFIITSLEYSGEHQDVITFSASFVSAGEITWSAA
ncbi:MAG: phage major tail protein, TP901-1 family [Pseudomonadota bacterium]